MGGRRTADAMVLEWLASQIDQLLALSGRIAVALESIAVSLAPAADDRRRLHMQAANDRTNRELTTYLVDAIAGVEESVTLAGVACFDSDAASPERLPHPVDIQRTPTV